MRDLVLRILELRRRRIPECWPGGVRQRLPVGGGRDIVCVGEAGRHCDSRLT